MLGSGALFVCFSIFQTLVIKMTKAYFPEEFKSERKHRRTFSPILMLSFFFFFEIPEVISDDWKSLVPRQFWDKSSFDALQPCPQSTGATERRKSSPTILGYWVPKFGSDLRFCCKIVNLKAFGRYNNRSLRVLRIGAALEYLDKLTWPSSYLPLCLPGLRPAEVQALPKASDM